MTGIVDQILGENFLSTHKTNSAKQAGQRDNATEQMTKLRRFTPT